MDGAEARKLAHIVIRTRRAFKQAICKSIKQHGIDLTFETLQVINSLWQEEGVSQQTLAERVAKNKASLTGLLANLEKKGYIFRRECTDDRRNKRVFLTAAGKELQQTVKPAIGDVYVYVEKALGLDSIRINQNLFTRLYGIVEDY